MIFGVENPENGKNTRDPSFRSMKSWKIMVLDNFSHFLGFLSHTYIYHEILPLDDFVV